MTLLGLLTALSVGVWAAVLCWGVVWLFDALRRKGGQ